MNESKIVYLIAKYICERDNLPIEDIENGLGHGPGYLEKKSEGGLTIEEVGYISRALGISVQDLTSGDFICLKCRQLETRIKNAERSKKMYKQYVLYGKIAQSECDLSCEFLDKMCDDLKIELEALDNVGKKIHLEKKRSISNDIDNKIDNVL